MISKETFLSFISVLLKGTLAKQFRKERKQLSPTCFTKPDSNAGKFQLKTRKQYNWPKEVCDPWPKLVGILCQSRLFTRQQFTAVAMTVA